MSARGTTGEGGGAAEGEPVAGEAPVEEPLVEEPPLGEPPVGEPQSEEPPAGERPERSWIYQLIGGAFALAAVVAVVAVLVTRSLLQAPAPEAEGRVRGTSFDSFNRADGAKLENTATGRPWQVVSGEWSVEDARAVAKPDSDVGGGNALAMLDTGVPDQYVQATFFDPGAGSGLVTRFQGPNNFIGVTFAPVSGTVQLGVTVDGRRAEPSKIGSALAEGEVTLGVRTEGQNVIVYVNGIESGRQVVPELRDGTRVGVLVRAAGQGASKIDDVVAVPLSTEAVGVLGGGGASEGGAPQGSAPQGSAPKGSAPKGSAGTPDTQAGTPSTQPGTPDTKAGAPTPGALEPGGAPTPAQG